MPKFCLALAGLTLVVGCAAPVDRTRQLLELDLANRQDAIESLQTQQKRQQLPWQAYSLGVLYGADGDFEKMNHWFDRCRNQTNTYDQDMEFIRLGHWRDEARSGDLAVEAQNYSTAVLDYEKALLAAPEKADTRLCLVEARVMTFGPRLEEIRILVRAERPQVLYRWLEWVQTPEMNEIRLETKVWLASQLSGVKREVGDDLAYYLVGELNRLDGQWVAMAENYQQAGNLEPQNLTQIKETRNNVSNLLLQDSLAQWANDNVPAALAKLDTADVVDPGRADIFQARRNIIALDLARTPHQVAETLAVGDLDLRWLSFWMSRMYTRDRLREAGMVANELLRHQDSLIPAEKGRALRVRVAYCRSIGHLDQTRDDLRELLNLGGSLPLEAVILGDVLLAQSSYEEARHWFDMAQGWGDDSVSLILKKARIAFSQDQFGEMEDLALEAMQREPDNTEANQILTRARTLNSETEVR